MLSGTPMARDKPTYTKVIAISPEDKAYIVLMRGMLGKQTEAGMLAEIIQYYRLKK